MIGTNTHVGKGRVDLKEAVKEVNRYYDIVLDLIHIEKGGSLRGDFRQGKLKFKTMMMDQMSGISRENTHGNSSGYQSSDDHSLSRSQIREIEEQRKKIQELRLALENTKDIENALLNDLDTAENKVDELMVKSESDDRRIAELEDLIRRNAVVFEEMKAELMKARAQSSIDPNMEQQLEDLESENQDLRNRLKNAEEDVVILQSDLDELYTAKYESEIKLQEEVAELREEVERLKRYGAGNGDQVVVQLRETIFQLEEELIELRAIAASASIIQQTITNTFISNTSIVNNTTTTINNTTSINITINNIIANADVDQLKEVLFSTLAKYEQARWSNAQLLANIQPIVGKLMVCCRVRPPSPEEMSNGGKICIDASDDRELICFDAKSNLWKSYQFDHVWNHECSQADVYTDLEPMLVGATDGKDICVMCYGQGGTGKTFTITGFGDQFGISFRAIEKVLDILEQRKLRNEADNSQRNANNGEVQGQSIFEYSAELSMFEIVDETVFDLFDDVDTDADPADRPSAEIFVDAPSNDQENDGDVLQLEGLTRVPIKSLNDAIVLYTKKAYSRAEGQVKAHTIMQLHLYTSNGGEPHHSSCFFVDLASSYADDDTDVREGGTGEGELITGNEQDDPSLQALGEVMIALRKKIAPVPYNKGILTRVLQNCLHPPARTAMIFNITPTDNHFVATVIDLTLASKVHKIRMGPAPRVGSKAGEKLKEMKFLACKEELNQLKLLNKAMQKKAERTKATTTEYVAQMTKISQKMTTELTETKTQKQRLAHDLSLTQKNLMKAYEELKRQKGIIGQLLAIAEIKLDEEEAEDGVQTAGDEEENLHESVKLEK